MLQQVFIDSQYSDLVLGDGSQVFWLGGAIDVPEHHNLQVKVLNAWIPHTFYSVFPANDTLVVRYYPAGEPQETGGTIAIPHGNRSIDEILDIINPQLDYGYECSYDVATNRLNFASANAAALAIEPGTTCTDLLGLSIGDHSVAGVLTARRGVDLTRTSSIIIRSNLNTDDRDPVTRRTSDIQAKIPLTSQFNELGHFSAQAWVDCKNMQLSYMVVKLVDDHGRLLDLNGARFTLTIKVRIVRDDGPIPDSVSAFASERAALASGRQLVDPTPARHTSGGDVGRGR